MVNLIQKKIVVETTLAPAAVGTYSQGIVHDGVSYFSGQIGLDPQTQLLAIGFSNQLQQIMKNIDGLLESQQLTRENIIKTTIFLTDLGNFAEVNIAYQNFFTAPYPARSTVQVSGLPKGALVEIEVLAAK
jgi:2-iminobutanoate/2-iminopropanoate deaminase